jgi:hypothetical protein
MGRAVDGKVAPAGAASRLDWKFSTRQAGMKGEGRILDDLALDATSVTIAPPGYTRLADEVSEAWAERFREERQRGWSNRGW